LEKLAAVGLVSDDEASLGELGDGGRYLALADLGAHREAGRSNGPGAARQSALVVGLRDKAIHQQGGHEAARLEDFVGAELRRHPAGSSGIEAGAFSIKPHGWSPLVHEGPASGAPTMDWDGRGR
jgi:hypothetical protein